MYDTREIDVGRVAAVAEGMLQYLPAGAAPRGLMKGQWGSTGVGAVAAAMRAVCRSCRRGVRPARTCSMYSKMTLPPRERSHIIAIHVVSGKARTFVKQQYDGRVYTKYQAWNTIARKGVALSLLFFGTFETCAVKACPAAAASAGLPRRTVIGDGGGGPPVPRSVTVAASAASAASASMRLPALTEHQATRMHVLLA